MPIRNIVVGRDGRHWNSILLMVPQAEEWQIERFGKFNRTASPGLNLAIPIIDRIAYKRSLKETTIAIHPQTAITKDNVHVQLDGAGDQCWDSRFSLLLLLLTALMLRPCYCWLAAAAAHGA